jgi:hypothetical protein
MLRRTDLLLPLLFISIFLTSVILSPPLENRSRQSLPEGEVVITAPVQVMMFGGDRFLAANIEAIRAATISSDNTNASAYRIRAHRVVSELNPCHEDNYYLANAVLTWGGNDQEGTQILGKAMNCRFWDEIPPFFYGFNLYFFNRDIKGAVPALEIAASRSEINSALIRKFAIMIAVEEINDAQLALDYLREQRRITQDPKLAALLDKRLIRLEGLTLLRDAQKRYEKQFGKPLDDPGSLLTAGLLTQFPADPLGLGYEFHEGRFRLRTMKIQGLENSP